MSKFSLLAMVAIAALTACSASARTEAETTDMIAAPAAAEAIAPAYVAPIMAEAPVERVQHASYNDVTCEVRSRRTSNGLLIQARAFADRDIDASYDLRIVKSGGGNSSEVSQSGDFSLDAGSSATLGENEMSFERGSHLRAYLTISDAHGELCQRTFRL